MVSILRNLRAEHVDMARILDLVEREIAALSTGGRPDYDLLEDVLDYCLHYPDQVHHPKEDEVYRKLESRNPEAAAKIGDLQGAHEKLGALTRRFAQAIDSVLLEAEMPRERIEAIAHEFVAAYREHLDMEERLFFPLAEKCLDAGDWAEISIALSEAGDPLFGPVVAKRYRELRSELLRLS